MITIRDLEFSYDNSKPGNDGFAIGVNELHIPSGQSTALVGPSGSGKTTLLGLVAGTLRPARGLIEVNGKRISDLGDGPLGKFRIRHIGQVFQSFELLAYLTTVENVLLPWYIAGDGHRSEIRRRAEGLLAGVGLGTKLFAFPDELSQGEKQRVAVCRAMLNTPPLLLADEPTGNLDQTNKQLVVDLLLEQAQESDSTLVMVTHDESLLGKFSSVLDIHSIARPGKGELRQ